MEAVAAVRAFWDQSAKRKSDIVGTLWTSHWAVQERINTLVSGSPNIDMYQHAISLLQRHGLKLPVATIASLGCGTGELERGLSTYNLAKEYWGFDLSDQSLAMATEAARPLPATFRYEPQNLNAPCLGEKLFDIVFAVMSLHHVEEIEALAEAIDHALRAGGWLVINEYVGPNRFQWTDQQIAVINSVLEALPPRLKTVAASIEKQRVVRETVETMIRVDASEAVRSQDIIPVLEGRFDLIERRDYGGCILHMLLADIIKNFQGDDALAVLRQIFVVEDLAIAGRLVPSDFTFAIYRKRG